MSPYTPVAEKKFADHSVLAAKAREAGGEWVYALNRKTKESARFYKRTAETAISPFYAPAGSFEVRFEMADSGYDAFIRTT